MSGSGRCPAVACTASGPVAVWRWRQSRLPAAGASSWPCAGLLLEPLRPTATQQHPEAEPETVCRAAGQTAGREQASVSETGHMFSGQPPVTALEQRQKKEQGTEGWGRQNRVSQETQARVHPGCSLGQIHCTGVSLPCSLIFLSVT